MKILHIAHHFSPCTGGIESFIESAIIHTQGSGIEHEVICLDKCRGNPAKLKSKQNISGTAVTRIPFLDLHFYKIAPGVLKLVQKSDADLLHIHGLGFFSDFLALTKPLHKKPLLISTHGGIFHTKNISLLKKFYFFGWSKLLLRNAGFIAHSKTDLELFSKISRKVTLFPYPIDLRMFAETGSKKNGVLLFVGRIYNNKRIDRLVNALHFLKKKKPGAILRIVGPDWGEMKLLVAEAKKLGIGNSVVFAGEKKGKELAKEFSNACVFVSASEFEGFGISVLEAMAAGCIVAVNNIKAFRNFVENGKNGFLLDYSRPELAAKVLAEIMGRAVKPGIIANAKRTALLYSWQKNAEKLIAIYRGALQ